MNSKRATVADFDAYYYLRCDEENIKWTGYSATPNKSSLFKWYLENIKKEERSFYLFFEGTSAKILGYLYLDVIGDKKHIVDIGYGVHSSYSGKGYGTQIVKFALNYAQASLPNINYLQARVATDNAGSIKVMLKCGLARTGEVEEVDFPYGEKKLFEKFRAVIK